jgi:hypothetical protein
MRKIVKVEKPQNPADTIAAAFPGSKVSALNFKRQRYQKGNVRKVPRSHGFAWEFRYCYTDVNGNRREKVQAFESSAYATEFEVRKAMESQMSALNDGAPNARADATFGELISQYLKET